MTARLSGRGFPVGDSTVRIYFALPYVWDGASAALFDPASWTLEYYDTVGAAWASPVAGEAVLSIRWAPGDALPGEAIATRRYVDVVLSCMVHATAYRLSVVSPDVDVLYDEVLFYFDDPEQVSLEVEGFGTIPSRYLDLNRGSSTFSQKINVRDLKCDTDAATFYLVDLLDQWTTQINPFRVGENYTTLDGGITAAAVSLTMTDATAFSDGDTAYIGREAILLGGKAVNTFATCTRGTKGTAAVAHSDGDKISDINPSWCGRIMRVRVGSDYVWSGIITSIEPESATCIAVEADGILSALDVDVGRTWASGVVSDLYWASSEVDVDTIGRTGWVSDRFSLEYVDQDGSVRTYNVVIPSGVYDTTSATAGLPGNLIEAVRIALLAAGAVELPGQPIIQVNEKNKVEFRLWSGFNKSVRLFDVAVLDDGRTAACSLLYSLGFDYPIRVTAQDVSSSIGFPINEADEEFDNRRGFNARSHRLLLDAPSGALTYDSDAFPDGGYAVVDDVEYIQYAASGSGTAWVATTLDGGIGDSATTIGFAAAYFRQSVVVLIGTEYIILGPPDTTNTTVYNGCIRGALGSTAAAHLTGATVTFIALPCLTGITRAMGGTDAVDHAPGVAVDQADLWTSPVVDAVEDVVSALALPTAAVGPSFSAEASEALASAGSAFSRWGERGTTRAAVITDMLRPYSDWLTADAGGALYVDTIRPLLRHETADLTVTPSLVTEPPRVSYEDARRVSSVQIKFASGKQKESKFTFADNQDPDAVYFRKARRDYKVEIKCQDVVRSADRMRRLGRRLLFTYARARTAFSAKLLWRHGLSLQMFDRIALNLPQVHSARGTRGIVPTTTHYYITEIKKDLGSRIIEIAGEEGITGVGFNFAAQVEAGGYDAGSREFSFAAVSAVTGEPLWLPDWYADTFLKAVDYMVLVDKATLIAGTGTWRASKALRIASVTVTSPTTWKVSFTDTNFTDTGGGMYYPDRDVGGGAATLTPTAGDILQAADYDDVKSGNKTLINLAYLADDTGLLGTDDDPAMEYTI